MKKKGKLTSVQLSDDMKQLAKEIGNGSMVAGLRTALAGYNRLKKMEQNMENIRIDLEKLKAAIYRAEDQNLKILDALINLTTTGNKSASQSNGSKKRSSPQGAPW